MFEALLAHVANFVKLTPEEEDALINTFKFKKLKRKQILFQQGEISPNFYFITKGLVNVNYINQEGEESIIKFVEENNYLGDMYSFITGNPSCTSAETIEDSEFLFFNNSGLEGLFKKSRSLETYARLIIRQDNINYVKRIIDGFAKTAEEKYSDFIQNYPQLKSRVSQKQIASYISITPESLSRIRKENVTGT